jgi:hypothetical protein
MNRNHPLNDSRSKGWLLTKRRRSHKEILRYPDEPPGKDASPRRADGTLLLHTALPFKCSTTLIHEYLVKAAEASPARIFLAERRRDGPGWETITYAAAQQSARRIAGFLLRLSVNRVDAD